MYNDLKYRIPKLELLQVIRAIAALAVVFFHSHYKPGYGAYGVSIFFVLSGVIMAMLLETAESSIQFIQRRLIRIVPLYWCTTTLMAIVTWLLPSSRLSGNLGGIYEYILSLLFIPFRAADGCIVPILGPGWSINYEMIFYFTCTLGLLLNRRYSTTITVLLVLFWWCLAKFSPTVAGEFYHRTIVLLFIAGMGLWRLSKFVTIRIQSLYSLILIPIACTILAYLDFLGNHYNKYHQGLIFFWAIVVVAIGLFCEPAFQKIKKEIRSLLIEIGDASYAIYLTHLFVIRLLLMIAPIVKFNRKGLGLAIVSVIASSVVGVLLHRYFDSPLQKTLKRFNYSQLNCGFLKLKKLKVGRTTNDR